MAGELEGQSEGAGQGDGYRFNKSLADFGLDPDRPSFVVPGDILDFGEDCRDGSAFNLPMRDGTDAQNGHLYRDSTQGGQQRDGKGGKLTSFGTSRDGSAMGQFSHLRESLMIADHRRSTRKQRPDLSMYYKNDNAGQRVIDSQAYVNIPKLDLGALGGKRGLPVSQSQDLFAGALRLDTDGGANEKAGEPPETSRFGDTGGKDRQKWGKPA